MLAPDGVLVVVTAAPDHLAELVDAVGLLQVGERKEERLDEQLGAPLSRRRLGWQLSLSRAEAALLVGMGPSAWHSTEDAALARLSEPFSVTASVTLSRYGRS